MFMRKPVFSSSFMVELILTRSIKHGKSYPLSIFQTILIKQSHFHTLFMKYPLQRLLFPLMIWCMTIIMGFTEMIFAI